MKHDPLFKVVLGTPIYAAEHIGLFLPKTIVDHLDLDNLEVVLGTFIDKELDERRTDLLFSVPVRGRNTSVLVYVLLEHQRNPDPVMPLRMLEYMVRIWDHWQTLNPDATRLPPIFPMILFQGKGTWNMPRLMSELIFDEARLGPDWRRFIPDFDIRITELALVDDGKLGGPAHATTMRFMNLAHDRDLKEKAKSSARLIEDLRRLLDTPEGLRLLGYIMVYLAGRRDVDKDVITEILMDIVGEDKEEEVMNAGERWEHSVFTKGHEEGTEERTRSLCQRLLEKRFGRLPVRFRRKLIAASIPELELWFDRAIVAASLEEVFEQS